MNRLRHTTSRRRRKHEEHANHEAWAIPYADLLTLLLAFFVVMYAISSVNAGKYRVLSDSLFAAFRGAPRSMEPIQVGERQVGSGTETRPNVEHQAVLQAKATSSLAAVPVSIGLSKSSGGTESDGKLSAQATAAAVALSRVADEVERAMDDLVQKDLVRVRRSDFWIEVEMRTDILFPSGSARLADTAVDVIERLGTVLAPFPNPIRVEGHTDNKPIKTSVFYSNWELSAARAGSVVRVLANHGVAPGRLAVVGYGDQRPMKGNDTPEGRNANRRVVVVILSTELMRQINPVQLAGSGAGAAAAGSNPPPVPALAVPGEHAVTLPAGGNGNAGSSDSGVIVSPLDSPQAVPAPAAPVPPAQSSAAQTTQAIIQHNTGTEPAP